MTQFFSFSLTVWIFSLFLSGPALADFSVPRMSAPVVDQADLISEGVEQQLNSALRYVHDHSETQVAVLTLATLGELSIEQVSIQVAEKWKLGSEKSDKGVLVLVAPKERRMRIEVGQGLEGDLPDAISKRIIDQVMTPLFRSGDPERGIVLGVLNILKRTNPDLDLQQFFGAQKLSNLAQPKNESSPLSRIVIFVVMALLLLLFIRHPFLFLLFLSGAGRGGGGGFGGGSGRGGSWSGGGGGFSGGGSSGSW